MVKTITIADKKVQLRASGAVPRLYRYKFNQDIYIDLKKAIKSAKDDTTDVSSKDIEDMTVMENIVYIMALHGNTDDNGNVIDENFPKNVDDWLAKFDGVFSIYTAFQEAVELWGMNLHTTSNSKKKYIASNAK